MANIIIIEPCLSNKEYVDRVGRKKLRKLDTLGDFDKTLTLIRHNFISDSNSGAVIFTPL